MYDSKRRVLLRVRCAVRSKAVGILSRWAPQVSCATFHLRLAAAAQAVFCFLAPLVCQGSSVVLAAVSGSWFVHRPTQEHLEAFNRRVPYEYQLGNILPVKCSGRRQRESGDHHWDNSSQDC